MHLRPLVLVVCSLALVAAVVLGLFIAGNLIARANDADPFPPSHDVGKLRSHASVVPNIAVLQDRTGLLSASEVAALGADGFQSFGQAVPNLGLVDGAVWVRVLLDNSDPMTQSMVLTLDQPVAEHVDLYTGALDSDVELLYATGALAPYSARPIADNTFAFPLEVGPGATTELLLRIASDAPVRLNMELWRPDAYWVGRIESDAVFGMVLGMLVIMSIYNLLVFIVLRDRQHLLLAFSGLTVFASSALASGYSSHWLKPMPGLAIINVLAVSLALVVGVFVLLTISFLELKQRQSFLYWLLVGALCVILAAGIAALAGLGKQSFAVLMALLPPVLVVIFVSTIIVMRQGSRMAIYFLIAQTMPIVFGLLQSFSIFGIGPWLPTYRLAVPVNNLLLMLLMSLALADRINVLRADATRANAALSTSRRQLADYLDGLPFNIEVHDAQLKPIYLNAELRRNHPTQVRGWAEESYVEWLQHAPVLVGDTGEPYPIEKLPIIRAVRGEAAHADDLVVDLFGRKIPMEAWSVPLRDDQGKITAVITAFQDISARRAIEQELAGYRELLEERVVQRTAELAAVNTNLGARVAELSAINDIGRNIALISDLDRTLHKVASIICDLYDVPNVSIALVDLKRRELSVVAMEDRGSMALYPYLGLLIPYTQDVEPDLFRMGPVVISDVDAMALLPVEMRAELRSRGVAQVLLVPLITRDQEQGVIGLVTDDPLRRFTADELRVAQTIAGQIGAAIDARELLQEACHQRDVSDALRRTTAALSHSLDQQEVLRAILEQLSLVFDYEGAGVALVERNHLVIVDARGLGVSASGHRIDLNGSSTSLAVLMSGAPLLIDDTNSWDNVYAPLRLSTIRSWLGVPMVSAGRVIGVLYLEGSTCGVFAQPDVDVLKTFADQATVAVTNARLHQEAQVAAAISERSRIARDLHDAVTQTIFSANLIVDALPAQLPDACPDVQRNLVLLSQLTKGALAELRTLLLELRPENLINAPLDRLLSHLAAAFTGRMGIPVEVQASCVPTYRPPVRVQLGAYRIAQEALNNIAKHARADAVGMDLVVRQGQVRLAIFDNGCGFDRSQPSGEGLGLRIMRERAAEIGAQFWVESAPGAGCQLFFVWEAGDLESLLRSNGLQKDGVHDE